MPQDTLKYRNRLLARLSAPKIALLAPHLEHVLLKVRDVMEPADLPISHVFFIEDGVCSIVARMHGGRDIEVGLAGREGMTGTAVVQGDSQSPHVTFVQLHGAAYRIEADVLRFAMTRSQEMRQLFITYARALAIQVSYTALANGRSNIEERLARWLLMIHDRVDGDRFGLTHEFLSVMLGVRRPGVTVALHVLEGKGLIRSNRGELIVLDRDGLIELANGSYGVPEREYERLLAKFAAPSEKIQIVSSSD